MGNLVLQGGSVLTMDSQDTYFQRGRVVVEDGTITSVGGEEGDSPEAAMDASRCVVLPGFINAHTHLFLTMWRGLNDDLELFPWLEVLSPAIGEMDREDMRQSNVLGCVEAALTGTTTLRECCRYDPVITAEVASEIGLRSVSGGMPASEWFGLPLPTDLAGLAEETRRLLTQSGPFRGLARAHLGVHSLYNCSPEFILEAKGLSDQLGVPFGIHLAECTAELEIIRGRYGKSPVQHLSDLGVLDSNVIADHCVWFDEQDIETFRDSGARMVHNPLANAKLESGTAPIKQYLEAGIPVGLGTDSVVSNNSLSMFEVMKCGLMIQRAMYPSKEGKPLSAYDFLRMATISGAQVLGMGGEIGSLERGKRADMIAVRLPLEMYPSFENTVSHLVYSAKPSDIQAVIVDGRMIVREGKLQLVDGESLQTGLTEYFTKRWEQLLPRITTTESF